MSKRFRPLIIMVNVNTVYWGLAIDYDGGAATIENCYAIYQKR